MNTTKLSDFHELKWRYILRIEIDGGWEVQGDGRFSRSRPARGESAGWSVAAPPVCPARQCRRAARGPVIRSRTSGFPLSLMGFCVLLFNLPFRLLPSSGSGGSSG